MTASPPAVAETSGRSSIVAASIVALLIVVFPANIYMAIYNIQATSWAVPPVLLWLRLPLQVLLIWWLLWSTNEAKSTRS